MADFDLAKMLASTDKASKAVSPQITSTKSRQLGGALEELINEQIRSHVGRDMIIEAVKDTVANLAPKKIEVFLNGQQAGKIKAAHTQLNYVLRLLERGLVPWLYGDTGTGKTTLARQIAEGLNLPFYVYSMTESMPTSAFAGSKDVHGNFAPSQAYKWCLEGGVMLIDEISKGDPNTLAWWHMPLDNRIASFPQNVDNPRVELHKHCVILLADNTMGEGQTRDFVASNRQDKALRERVVFVPVDYDEELERILVGDKICDYMHHLRRRVRQEKIGRSISTRQLVQVHKLVTGDYGESNPVFSMKEAIELIIMPWSDAEKESVKDCFAMLRDELREESSTQIVVDEAESTPEVVEEITPF